MRRRQFIQAACSIVTAGSLPVLAQGKIARIGILFVSGTSADSSGPQPKVPYVAALIAGLKEHGWDYGRNFVTESRGGDGKPELFAALVAEVIAAQPDAIVSAGPFLSHLKRATSTIPVVMCGADDAVVQGYTTSLAHPSANMTGLTWQSVEIVGKRIELLRELVPGSGPIGVLWDQLSRSSWQAAQEAAAIKGWPLLSLELTEANDLEAAFGTAAKSRAEGLLVFASSRLFARQREVAELAARQRLPTMYQLRPYIDAGGLMSYSASLTEGWRRAAYFVDGLLRGKKPADIPIEQPTKFDLVVNLKAAKMLGLIVPQTLLARADEVIE